MVVFIRGGIGITGRTRTISIYSVIRSTVWAAARVVIIRIIRMRVYIRKIKNVIR
ncbi:MAG: hypothetical protein IPJ74_01635 [Saprospiraceae bacterium]|nr:hypothetical protein [Saprospiraceae bacterium]